MTSQEICVSFLCEQARLYGILHCPSRPSSRGVLLLAGRPALRSGRHRLYTLLARTWAEAGIPVMRFDYRGSGDSEGEMATLEQTREDIAAAIDAFQSNLPGLQEVVLWGLCGGATDAILYAPEDARVTGLVLANPWLNPWIYDSPVQTLGALRRRGSIYLRKARNWARSAGSGEATKSIEPSVETSSSLRTSIYEADPMASSYLDNEPDVSPSTETAAVDQAFRSYRVPDISNRLANRIQAFQGPVLIILSGKDTGAQAFKHTVSLSMRWRRLLSSKRVLTHEVPEANHSLRRPEWRDAAAAFTLEWLRTSI
jgi:alpha-beta hydrolase superfamily lysophospholipase